MKFLNDNTKSLRWYNKNYFYLTTIFFIGLICSLYFLEISKPIIHFDFGIFADLNKGIQNFVNCFFHHDLVHLIFNSISFLICGIYLERKIGTLPFFLLVITLTIFGSSVYGSVYGTSWSGYSVPNYACFGFAFINFLFSFKKGRTTKSNIITGLVVMAMIYFLMCADYRRDVPALFTLGDYDITLQWYPVDLLVCDGHISGFIAGSLLSLILEIHEIGLKKSWN